MEPRKYIRRLFDYCKRMKSIASLIIFLLIGCASSSSQMEHIHGNSVFVLGSLHGYMLKHPQFTLHEFIAAMDIFRPQIILTEVRANHSGPEEGSIDGGIEQSIVYAFGKEAKLPVVPVDWFDDTLLDAMSKEDAQNNPQFEQLVKPLSAEYERSFRHDSFFDLQGQKTQALVRSIYDLSEKYGRTLNRKRNENICENIRTALHDIRGKRILVVFGLDHKYFLEDCLKHQGNDIINATDFLVADTLKGFKVSSSLNKTSLANISAAEILLQTRLTVGVYQGAMKQKLTNKLKEFKIWREVVSTL